MGKKLANLDFKILNFRQKTVLLWGGHKGPFGRPHGPYPPPPLSALVRMWPTPPPPLLADVLCGRPL